MFIEHWWQNLCLANKHYESLCDVSVNRADEHNHASDNSSIKRGLLLKKIHKKIRSNPTVTVRRAYDEAANDSASSDDMPSFDNVRTRTKRFKAQFVPPLPANIDDVAIEGEWSRTWKNRRFLSHLDNNWGIAVFTTSKLLKILQQSSCVFIDGTFRTTPHPYAQFVSVHGLYQGFVIPLVFCLMTGKTIGQYRQVLRHLKREVLRVTGRQWLPDRMVLDFEQALMTAVDTELPACRLNGCYFHFTQSLWRKLQQLGLTRPYRRDRHLRDIVRKVMAIGFLPLLLVQQNFTILRLSQRVHRLELLYPALFDWLEYVQTTYVNQNSLFLPRVWNVYGRDMNTRANNHVEGMYILTCLE